MSNLTDNYNFLSPTGFKLVINRNNLANTEYFSTSVTLPSLNLGQINVPKNQYKGYLSGDITFDDFSIRIAIDEDMKVYKELYDWMLQNRDANSPVVYDATLIILTNHNLPNNKIQFTNLFPLSVSGLEFSTQATDVEYLQTDVSFRYDEFKIL
jgi:hypothetical protein